MHHRDKFLELKFKIISLRRFYSLFSLTTIIIGLKCKIFDDKVIFVGETFALFPFCYFLVKCNNEEKQRLIIFMLLLWVLLPFLDGTNEFRSNLYHFWEKGVLNFGHLMVKSSETLWKHSNLLTKFVVRIFFKKWTLTYLLNHLTNSMLVDKIHIFRDDVMVQLSWNTLYTQMVTKK